MRQYQKQPPDSISLTTLFRDYARIPTNVSMAHGLPHAWKWLHSNPVSPSRHVWVDRSCENLLNADQINELIKILAYVKGVEVLTINAHQYKYVDLQRNRFYQGVDCKAIALVLRRNRQLKALNITGRIRFDNENDLKIFNKALRYHPSLESLDLLSISVGSTASTIAAGNKEEIRENRSPIGIDSLILALRTLPNLKRLELVGDAPFSENLPLLGSGESGARIISSLLGTEESSSSCYSTKACLKAKVGVVFVWF